MTPSLSPSMVPSHEPSMVPTVGHSESPSYVPTCKPSILPAIPPTAVPSSIQVCSSDYEYTFHIINPQIGSFIVIQNVTNITVAEFDDINTQSSFIDSVQCVLRWKYLSSAVNITISSVTTIVDTQSSLMSSRLPLFSLQSISSPSIQIRYEISYLYPSSSIDSSVDLYTYYYNLTSTLVTTVATHNLYEAYEQYCESKQCITSQSISFEIPQLEGPYYKDDVLNPSRKSSSEQMITVEFSIIIIAPVIGIVLLTIILYSFIIYYRRKRLATEKELASWSSKHKDDEITSGNITVYKKGHKLIKYIRSSTGNKSPRLDVYDIYDGGPTNKSMNESTRPSDVDRPSEINQQYQCKMNSSVQFALRNFQAIQESVSNNKKVKSRINKPASRDVPSYDVQNTLFE
jgi:hypothetical protein